MSAFGFETATETVEMTAEGIVTLAVDLVPLPRGSVSGIITSVDGDPVADATVSGAGIEDWTATTGDDGGYTADGCSRATMR